MSRGVCERDRAPPVKAVRRIGERARVQPQRWLALLEAGATPPSPITAAIGRGRLVVVAPHPDDEVLACAGLLLRAQAAGWPALVIAVTGGERSHGPGTTGGRARLARQRSHEQRRSAQALGLAPAALRRLRLPDGAVACHEAPLQRRLAGLFEPGDTVVVTSRIDGHPDHEATARATLAAALDVGCRVWEAPVWLWHWARPYASGSRGCSCPCPCSCLGALGSLTSLGKLGRLDLDASACRRKRQALRRHRSQRQARSAGAGAVLCRDIQRRAAWPVEFFFEVPP